MTKLYNLLIAEERTDKNSGEVKTFWHRVGTVFPHRKGEGFNVVIPYGMALSGKLLILPRTEKGEAVPNAEAQAEFDSASVPAE